MTADVTSDGAISNFETINASEFPCKIRGSLKFTQYTNNDLTIKPSGDI